MNYLVEAFKQSLQLIASFDSELLQIVKVSVTVSSCSTLLCALVGIPLGIIIGTNNYWGKRGVVTIVNTLMALPTVVVGLTVYSFISRMGPFGQYGLLFTPTAMVIGQFILALPIVIALTIAALGKQSSRVEITAITLGANLLQRKIKVIVEAKLAIFAAVIAAFGRVFAEVGVSMMLGGNIKYYTRNITTAIAMETSKGEFALGIALGIILLSIAFGINILFQILKQSHGHK